MASLQSFLDTLPDSEILNVTEEIELDYAQTALVLGLEAKQRFPVVRFERPKGYDVPVVANLFSDRKRIARMAGAADFNTAWNRALAGLIPRARGSRRC